MIQMKHYFITGATGAIGAALAPVLLEDENIAVDLLIRAKSRDHLNERMEKLFEFWEFDAGDERKERINAVTGDIRLPQFGMAENDYNLISGHCTHIIHCAGNVRMNLPIEEARRCSVDSSKNVIALAQACQKNNHLEKIEFVSTVGVGGRMKGVVSESWIEKEREFHNTYEQAKAEAEDYIKTQVEKGFPITVHRPSMVVGNSKTGKIIHFQIFYHLCEFLSGRRTLGIIPDTGDTRLDTIPSDYVAKVIAWSSKNFDTSGKIFHECSGPKDAILISDLKQQAQELFKAMGVPLPRSFSIPAGLFKIILPVIGLVVTGKAKRAIKALPIFFDYLSENQGFENNSTMKILHDKIERPVVGLYLEQVLSSYLVNIE